MRRKKNQLLLPIILFAAVLALSFGGLLLADYLRKAKIENPGEYATQDDIPRLTAAEAYQAVLDGDAVLVDTRAESQFQVQRAAGSINIPIDQTESLIPELDPDTWYITYCT
jgi:hypothetical protein